MFFHLVWINYNVFEMLWHFEFVVCERTNGIGSYSISLCWKLVNEYYFAKFHLFIGVSCHLNTLKNYCNVVPRPFCHKIWLQDQNQR